MTCIVGLIDKVGDVWIGGDSAGVTGLNIIVRKDVKVFRNGDYLIGCTSSFRMIQLLQYSFRPESPPDHMNLHGYMCTTFVDGIRDCFSEGGFIKRNNDEESGGVFLVGVKNRLFRIDDDFQVEESTDGFSACGSGEQYALAVLNVTKNMHPEKRIKKALETATYFNAGVRPPFLILNNKII